MSIADAVAKCVSGLPYGHWAMAGNPAAAGAVPPAMLMAPSLNMTGVDTAALTTVAAVGDGQQTVRQQRAGEAANVAALRGLLHKLAGRRRSGEMPAQPLNGTTR